MDSYSKILLVTFSMYVPGLFYENLLGESYKHTDARLQTHLVV